MTDKRVEIKGTSLNFPFGIVQNVYRHDYYTVVEYIGSNGWTYYMGYAGIACSDVSCETHGQALAEAKALRESMS